MVVEAKDWTCERCGVTASWAGGEKRKLPDGWAKERGKVHCLACRRDLAAERALDGVPEDASGETRRKLSVAGRIEFELKRTPDAADGEVAKACRSSVAAVRTARERLGI